jgi:hypothetical protein
VRRVIRSSLDANMERPELRQFKGDPVATVLADRGRYIAAVLTVVRAYLAADCPGLLPSLASFSDWSRLVRSAIVWLGRADPIMTMNAARDDDPARGNLRAVVAVWLAAIGPDRPLTVGDLLKAGNGNDDFRKALLTVARARRQDQEDIDALRLGRWLARNKGRVVDDYKIVGMLAGHSKQMEWQLTGGRLL